MNKGSTILIVEDDLISAEYLKNILENEDYNVLEIVDTGANAIKSVHEYKPDVVLMDIMLKDNVSGCDAALKIHYNDPETKIIFITAYADDEMLEYANESEAYAYLMKPYREKEIIATLKLALAHKDTTKSKVKQEVIKLIHGYSFNTKIHRLCYEGKEVPLGEKALKLLEILVRYKDITVSNEQICLYVWGEKKTENTLRSLVFRIRSSVDHDIVQNVNGLGYKISTP